MTFPLFIMLVLGFRWHFTENRFATFGIPL